MVHLAAVWAWCVHNSNKSDSNIDDNNNYNWCTLIVNKHAQRVRLPQAAAPCNVKNNRIYNFFSFCIFSSHFPFPNSCISQATPASCKLQLLLCCTCGQRFLKLVAQSGARGEVACNDINRLQVRKLDTVTRRQTADSLKERGGGQRKAKKGSNYR